MKRSDQISNFLDFVAQIKNEYAFAKNAIENEDKLTQDILHKFELEKLSGSEKSKLATELKKNRQNRRFYKDIIEETEELLKFCEENKRLFDILKQHLGKLRKVESYHCNRTYRPKVRKSEAV